MKRYTKISYIVLSLLLAALFITACGNKKTGEGAAEETAASDSAEGQSIAELSEGQYRSAGIVIGSPEMKPLSGVLKVNGFIDVPPQNLVSITTQMGGIVRSTPLLQGSTVKKGQVIAVLENQEYVQLQQDYLESKSQLELADAEYKRQQALAEQNVNSQKTLQQAKAAWQSRMAQVSALKERLHLININPGRLSAATISSRVNIYSPVNGYVTKVNVNTGKFINPNDVMFEIVNGSNLHVELNVFEKDAARIRPGQKVRFTLANDTLQRTATVNLVGRDINPDKTIRVHTIADGASGHFIPGTYVKAFIEAGSQEVPALPGAAVVDFEGKKYAFISKGSRQESSGKLYRFEMTEVTTGIADGGYVEVRFPENIPANGNVVIKGAYDLLSKMKNSEEE